MGRGPRQLVAGPLADLLPDGGPVGGGAIVNEYLLFLTLGIGTGALYEKAARGLIEQLQDPYSELYTPKQLAEFQQNTGGRYAGLGMQIEPVQGRGVSVMKIFPNTPAEKAGVQPGDVIVQIDTTNTRDWNSQQVSDVLKGEPGSKVTVSFQRTGVPQLIQALLGSA